MQVLQAGRRSSTAIALAMLAMVGAGILGGSRALANEDTRACLSREAAAFYGKLAAAVLGSAIDASKIDDHFIAQATDTIVETCKQAAGTAEEADIAAFKDYMAKWSAHLDRKIGELTTLGGAD